MTAPALLPSTGPRTQRIAPAGRQPPPPVDRIFRELPDLLQPGDLLVFNDTQVIKGRLFGEKSSGGKLELLVERVARRGPRGGGPHESQQKPLPGAVLFTWPVARARAASPPHCWDAGPTSRRPVRFRFSGEPHALMQRHGQRRCPVHHPHRHRRRRAPLPDRVCRHPGAVAAPTAALHFDEALLAQIEARGVARASVTLHVGAGTFQPVKTEHLHEHTMHRR